MKRLVCVVEGKGEVAAIPNLCARVIHHLEAWDWIVDEPPVRQPRGMLVDARTRSPRRSCSTEGLRRAVELAKKRRADGVLVVCDADDDCPAVWGPSAVEVVRSVVPGGAVMAVREYETWLLLSYSQEERDAVRVRGADVRDAKGELEKLVPGYLPTTHQLQITRRLDIPALRARSDSFDKLVRTLAEICGVKAAAPQRRHTRAQRHGPR